MKNLRRKYMRVPPNHRVPIMPGGYGREICNGIKRLYWDLRSTEDGHISLGKINAAAKKEFARKKSVIKTLFGFLVILTEPNDEED